MLPEMLKRGVVAMDFASNEDFRELVSLDANAIDLALDQRIPSESTVARNTLTRFLGMRPGDIVALKSHSAPRGKTARLLIARYAVISGRTKAKYKRIDGLGHSMAVDFLFDQDLIELPYGYGRTLHEITAPARMKAIFRQLYVAASESMEKPKESTDKLTRESLVETRASYIMKRVHNLLQNDLRRQLENHYGKTAVKQEQGFIDLSVALPNKLILIEVKASPSPTYCIREALGQMLFYACNLNNEALNVDYLVVGPNEAGPEDRKYLGFICGQTNLMIRYCTPESYAP